MAIQSKKNKIISSLSRPPIVAVLGHVDHGKTTLLDAIRKSHIAQKEFGGITQHIGAYQVEAETKEGKRKITFIDTPGHEAFSKMRSRGAEVTDLVILVVAASEGVKPQTEESLAHIKKTGVPFIVAATKMDLSEANLDRVNKHLSKIGVLTEGYGGEAVVVPVSAVTKKGINELLEMILLVSEMKGLKGSKEDKFKGVVIESKLDNKRGTLATVLVKKGTLKRGDDVYIGEEKSRIRAMFDEYGKGVDKAYPSQPVEILGFNHVPPVGAIVAHDIDKEKEVTSIKKPFFKPTEKKHLKVILKADTLGSLEAILGKIESDRIEVLEASIGAIGESEIMLAQSTKAFVVGFNVKLNKNSKILAEQEKVLVKTYTIIYELLDELYDVADFITEGEKEEILGSGKIIAIFSTSAGKIAGIQVTGGRLVKNDKVKLVRGEVEVATGRILGLKQGKEEVGKVEQGKECGARLSSNLDFKIDDMLLSVKLSEIVLK